MSGYQLVRAETKEPFGKLPAMVPDGRPYKVLRFVEPNARKRPSGELVLMHTVERKLYRAAPPVFALNLIPKD